MEVKIKPDDMTPEEFQKAIDAGIITIKADNKNLKLISKWKYDNKFYWICKLGDHDFSIFDGMGVLDCTFTNLSQAEFSMKYSNAIRVIE